MITAEEKTRERFPDLNNRDNPERQNHQNNGHQDRKCEPNNTVAIADKAKSFPSLENLMTLKICTTYGTRTEVTRPEIIASLLIDTQERATMEKEKKITRRRMKTIKKIRDFKNPRER
jgi:hypothetical protein